MSAKQDINKLIGKRFGRLVVEKFSHIRVYQNPKNQKIKNIIYYLCRCDCGNTKLISKYDLTCKRGTKSCGCLVAETCKNNFSTHSLRKHRLYHIWNDIKSRCTRKAEQSYYRYGARGIFICDEWKNDFMSFYNWSMSNGYADNLTIDRIDVNGNYEPCNCRWATYTEQANNRRNNIIVTYNNETRTLKQWCGFLGVNYKLVWERMKKYNKTFEEAINQ